MSRGGGRMGMERYELEVALAALSEKIEFPPTPALVTSVRAGIAGGARRPAWVPRSLFGEGRSWRGALAAAVAVIAVFGGVMVFSPAARHAVADFFGLEGARIKVSPRPLPTDVPVLGEDLDLGDRVPLAQAEKNAGFDVLVPAELGAPDEVYSSPFTPRLVSLVYAPDAEVPEAAETGVGVLISEFPGRFVKGSLLTKIVHAGGRLSPVKVNGQPGYWISGADHVLYFRDTSGEVIEDTVRIAGDTLLWESGDVTLRLESALTKTAALRIARSVE